MAEFLIDYCNKYILDEYRSVLADVCAECNLNNSIPQVKGLIRLCDKMKQNNIE